MSRLRIALSSVFLLALAVVWAYLFVNTRAVDAARNNQVTGWIKQLKQLDAEWNVDVLKSQIELNKNYDPLVRPLGEIGSIMAQLRAETERGDSDQVRAAFERLAQAVEFKTGIIDRFKTQNAIIKNSTRYLPTAQAEIEELLVREPHGGLLPGAKPAGLELAIARAVSQVQQFNTAPDPDAALLITARLGEIARTAEGYVPAVREVVDNFVLHAETVLRQRARQAELLAQVAQVPISERVDALAAAFASRFDGELATQARFQQWLVYHSGFALAAIAAAVAFLVHRSRTEFKRMARVVEQTKAALRESETQLIHAEKMSMMGEIVGGIAHEINTPLGYLRSGLESAKENLNTVLLPYTGSGARLLDMLRTPDRNMADLQKVCREFQDMHRQVQEMDVLRETATLLDDGIDGVGHIHETVVNLLNFSRLDRTRVTHCRVEAGIDSTLKLASHILKKKVVRRRYGVTGEIPCDLSQLNQVFLNIIKNAVQATGPHGGEITITTAMQGNEWLSVSIADDGEGIDPKILPKIFDAFFTTKKAGSGTGLGLSICKRIIDSHGGRIEVQSTPGEGTTFTIWLPVTISASLQQQANEQHDELAIA